MRRKLQIQAPDSSLAGGAMDAGATANALSVSDFTRRIKGVLETAFDGVRVFGEVIGLSRPASGHVYFSLKDAASGQKAQVAAVLWRDKAARLRFPLEDGLLIVVEGRLAVYEPRGSYQIVVENVRPAGQGTLLLALERLKEKLHGEGLFDPSRKRPLPFLPRAVGIITSPSGAAVFDVLQSIYRRCPAHARIFPVRVQGEGSADEIVRAFELLGKPDSGADVAILTRGGGSLEDLWTFNEEKVARAVAGSPIPVISAVGHEVDVTLSDLAADVRAQTPTHAGAMVVPDLPQLLEFLAASGRRLRSACEQDLRNRVHRLQLLSESISVESLADRVRGYFEDVRRSGDALKKTLYNRLREWEDHFLLNLEKLSALNPLNVLRRGYSMTLDGTGRVVRDAQAIKPGEAISVVLENGILDATVSKVRPPRELEAPPWASYRPGFSAVRDARTPDKRPRARP